MSHRVAGAPLDFDALRAELEVPGDFTSEVSAEADSAASHVALPEYDRTDLPMVTIDPPGSRDLDQAVHIAMAASGFVVSYAIADVAAFVRPGSALDAETHRRGETLYFPDRRVPLHPPQLSESAASLLPGQIRPAVLWTIALDADGTVTSTQVRRARVRSTAQLDYAGVQASLDAGSMPAPIAALEKVGEARLAQARARHAIDLALPEQEASGQAPLWRLELRAQSAVERYNAEISLLTGMCAASIMLAGGIGLLRTVPPPDASAVAALRRAALAVGVSWPDGAEPGDVIAGVDRADPREVAFVEHATSLLRGAGYTPFVGARPEQTLHGGIGAPYAHVTAPLRRLVDRYGSEICLALQAGQEVPEWARAALPALPAEMQQADHRAHQVDRAVVDAVEAWLLHDRVGENFEAVVMAADDRSATVVLDDPAVRAKCSGIGLVAGERITACLTGADIASRQVRFERVDGP